MVDIYRADGKVLYRCRSTKPEAMYFSLKSCHVLGGADRGSSFWIGTNFGPHIDARSSFHTEAKRGIIAGFWENTLTALSDTERELHLERTKRGVDVHAS